MPRLLPGCYYVTRLEHLAWLPEGKNWPSRLVLPAETGQAPPSADLWPTWTRTRVGFPLCWEQGRVGVQKRNASAGCLLGASGEPLCPTLDPLPALLGGVGSIPLPTSPAATTPDMGYTEGPLLALKGSCVPLPARPPLLPAARTHSRAHRWTPRHTRPPSRNTQSSPPCLGDASACLWALNPGLEPQGRSLCLCQLELLECSERQNYSPAERQGPTPWDSPGRPRAVLVPSLGPGFPRKAPWEPGCPPWGCPPPGSIPEWKGPCILSIWGFRVAPGHLSRVGLASHTRPRGWDGADAHMRLLGGILRPSRNQVTCGRGKLEMRGARMTAASPWETLWCFSPSSKLPMSAGGKSTRRGQRPEVSNRDCPAPGWGVVGAQGNCRADTGWPPGNSRRVWTTSRGPITPSLTTACSAWCFWALYPFTPVCP